MAAALGLLLAGRRPTAWVTASAAAIAAFGVWSLLSVAWGGVPDFAWRTFDQSLLAAAVLVCGSMIAGGGRTQWVLAGVAAGVTAEAVEVLYRVQSGPIPADWLEGRKVQGLVGYANAQGAILAIGIPIAVWFACKPRLVVRAAAGAAAGALLGGMLLTQSRGALLALGIALLLQAALARDVRVLSVSIAIGLSGAALWLPLRHVDHALIDSSAAVQTAAFRHFVALVLVACVVLAAVAATPPQSARLRRALLAATLIAVLGATVGVAAARPGTFHELRARLHDSFSGPQPENLPGGTTRLTSLSLTGRVKTWRVGWKLYTQHPVIGAGRGEFARAWTVDRTDLNLYVLQPHSIELEALSELGIPGALFFAAFGVFGFLALLRRGRLDARVAACVAVLAVLLLQASVDWTFSFPALVAAVLLVVGVGAGAGRARPAGRALSVGAGIAAALILVGLAGQYFSARTLEHAAKVATSDPARAWDLASQARWYDRWSPDVVVLQAQIAETTGRYHLAATLFEHAAGLALDPWREEFLRAGALKRDGLAAEARVACRTAHVENPLEWRIQRGPCDD